MYCYAYTYDINNGQQREQFVKFLLLLLLLLLYERCPVSATTETGETDGDRFAACDDDGGSSPTHETEQSSSLSSARPR